MSSLKEQLEQARKNASKPESKPEEKEEIIDLKPKKSHKSPDLEQKYRDLLVEAKTVLKRYGGWKAMKNRPHHNDLLDLLDRITQILQ